MQIRRLNSKTFLIVIFFTEAEDIVEVTCIPRQSSKKLKTMYKYDNVQKNPVTYWIFLSDRKSCKKNHSLKL